MSITEIAALTIPQFEAYQRGARMSVQSGMVGISGSRSRHRPANENIIDGDELLRRVKERQAQTGKQKFDLQEVL